MHLPNLITAAKAPRRAHGICSGMCMTRLPPQATPDTRVKEEFHTLIDTPYAKPPHTKKKQTFAGPDTLARFIRLYNETRALEVIPAENPSFMDDA